MAQKRTHISMQNEELRRQNGNPSSPRLRSARGAKVEGRDAREDLLTDSRSEEQEFTKIYNMDLGERTFCGFRVSSSGGAASFGKGGFSKERTKRKERIGHQRSMSGEGL
jgi:hypothetical protein